MGKIADTTRSWTMGQEQRRQLLAFDAELDRANLKVRELEAQILDMEKEVKPLRREVDQLKQRLDAAETKAARVEKLAAHKGEKHEGRIDVHTMSDLDDEVLRYIAHVRQDDCTTTKIAHTIRGIEPFKEVSRLKVQYQLDRLAEVGLIGLVINMGGGDRSYWILQKTGLEYVVKKGLDK
jgi:chromosome segregation ATPase